MLALSVVLGVVDPLVTLLNHGLNAHAPVATVLDRRGIADHPVMAAVALDDVSGREVVGAVLLGLLDALLKGVLLWRLGLRRYRP